MSEKSLGEVLRESRVGKNITLDDIELKTGISSHYLLAM
ncbi:TPA: helix-turn-helix domain-containing protein, partial [Streptococcus pyogenes]|nr:helix-turn-helix domain-containing protein [Streptococcus pyogenes]